MDTFVLCLNSEGDGFTCDFYSKPPENILCGISDNILTLLDNAVRSYSSKINLMADAQGCYLTFTCDYDHQVKLDNSVIPSIVRDALLCTSREKVLAYIDTHSTSQLSNSASINIDAQSEVRFLHKHFYESYPALQNYSSIKGRAHATSFYEMGIFVRERNTFFEKNFSLGDNYQKMSVLNLYWILISMDYHYKSFKNHLSLSYPLLSGIILGVEFTHYCDDFDAGYRRYAEF